MKCPKCQCKNEKGSKFCLECGERLELQCPQCGNILPLSAKFCNKCGQELGKIAAEKEVPEAEGERKYVTVLFSDLSGYTAMSEKLDPEEVKEITTRIFGEVSKVIEKYDGFVEKFVGDAVMALFGVPKAHEDDPVRAIRAAREIHDIVQNLSPEIEKKIGKPLSMHSGINTGLVVTGEVNMEKGTHGVAGDTINLASRLCGLAKSGEILVCPHTSRQAEGYYTFEALAPTKVKGKRKPVMVHKVLSPKEQPVTIHRLSGLRADLIGRKAEMNRLGEAVEKLRQGKGLIFSICGDAGTGKSRLVEEFKATVDLSEIQWREGHAYAYSQNIPYFPLIDMLNRTWQIEESDPPKKVRAKIESGIEHLIGKTEDVVPYIGSLYSLSYPEIEGVSPEFWKDRLEKAIQELISALTQRAPTIIYLEDLHWADTSSLDLLRFILSEFSYPALFLFVYRPPFSLFTSHQLKGMGSLYQEIRLQDFSPSDAQDMVESLLKDKAVPPELQLFIQEKVESNPFYLEEVINSLIESGTLTRDNGTWKITRPISESDIPSTIHGVIGGRLDRLKQETKRILQEASVIGRAFLYKILKQITELKKNIRTSLKDLELLDLIRIKIPQPDLEYIFKHALTQEVVYNGLLKKERREIHERIGLVMEQLFSNRLSEYYEALAFHFMRGKSVLKAVEYLMKSGEKSLKRYAVEESHQYFKKAFDLLTNKPDMTKEENSLFINLLIKWSLVYYYRGDWKGLTEILKAHKNKAELFQNKASLGMFYAWLGFSLYARDNYKDSARYLQKALEIGKEIENQQVLGYACAWLTYVSADLGLLDEALQYGKKTQEIFKLLESEHYLFFKSLAGTGLAYFYMGDRKKMTEVGKTILNFGQRHSNIRSMVLGHMCIGGGHIIAGDLPSAIACLQQAADVAADPFYYQIAQFFLCMSYVQNNQFTEAEEGLREVISYCQNFGCEWLGRPACEFLGLVLIATGQMTRGLKMVEEAQQSWIENGRKSFLALTEYILGKIYFQISEGTGPTSLSTMAKNIGFLIKNVPFARKKAEDHFNKAIEVAKEIGAKGVLGPAYLYLGLLHKTKRKKDKARECISEAVQIFEQCEAETFLKQAKEALASLT